MLSWFASHFSMQPFSSALGLLFSAASTLLTRRLRFTSFAFVTPYPYSALSSNSEQQ